MKRWGRLLLLALLLVGILWFYNRLQGPSAPSSEKADNSLTANMKVAKDTVDFRWLSDNGTTVIRNVCHYSYPAAGLDTAVIIQKRDSMLGIHIHGEEPQMYMATEHRLPIVHQKTTNGDIRTTGQWEMEGDMMGGSFVCYSHYNPQLQRVEVHEAFVYGPDRDKETVLKRLEESLLSPIPENSGKSH